jgi:opacity protein-like surface antigen
MKKLAVVVACLFVLSGLAMAADVTGWVTDAACGGKGRAGEGHAACAKKCIEKGGDIVLVTDEKKVIKVHNPDAVKSKAGEKVTVSGKLDGDSIHVDSVK